MLLMGLVVPVPLVVQRALDLPTLLQAQVLQEDLEVREVDSSKYDQGRRDLNFVRWTRS